MVAVTGLTADKTLELVAGWEEVAAQQATLGTKVTDLDISVADALAAVANWNNNIFPQLQQDLAANDQTLADLQANVLPNLTQTLADNDSAIQNLVDIDLPALDARLTVAESSVGNVDLSGLQADLDLANQALDLLQLRFPIGTVDIAEGAITADKILAGQITALHIVADTITANEIAADTITANEIAADTITANEIAAGTITAAEIAADTITANEIGAGVITALEIAADTITANEIAADTITANEIAADTITANEIAADSITSNEIAADTITANEIAAETITAAEIAALTITGAQIQAGAINSAKLEADSVIASKIAAGNIEADHIAAGAITTSKLAADSVTASKIKAGEITGDKITATFTITGKTIKGGTLLGTSIQTSQTADTGPRMEMNADSEGGFIKGFAEVMKNGEDRVTAPVLINPRVDRAGDARQQVLHLSSGAVGTGVATIDLKSGSIDGTLWDPLIKLNNEVHFTMLARAFGNIRMDTGQTVVYDGYNNEPGGTNAVFNGSGAIIKGGSSRTLKKNINPLPLAEARKVLMMEPVSFQWIDSMDMGDFRQAGFIAEQAAEVGAELWVTRDAAGKPSGIRYQEVTAALLLMVKNLVSRIEVLEGKTKVIPPIKL